MNRSNKTRLLLRDKYKVVHSDRLYRPIIDYRACRCSTDTNNDTQADDTQCNTILLNNIVLISTNYKPVYCICNCFKVD